MLVLLREGHGPRRIVSILADEGVSASAGVWRHTKTGHTTQRRGSGGATKATETEEVKAMCILCRHYTDERWPERRCVQTELWPRLAVWQLCDEIVYKRCKSAAERSNQRRIVWGCGTAVVSAACTRCPHVAFRFFVAVLPLNSFSVPCKRNV